MAKHSPLTKAIMALGRSPSEFVPSVLGITYATFRYRMRTGHLHLTDIHKLTHYLGKTFEELWPNPNKAVHQRLPLMVEAPTMSQQPQPKKVKEKAPRPQRQREAVVFNDEPPPIVEPPKESKPKREFRSIDVFGDGLPPIAREDPE